MHQPFELRLWRPEVHSSVRVRELPDHLFDAHRVTERVRASRCEKGFEVSALLSWFAGRVAERDRWTKLRARLFVRSLARSEAKHWPWKVESRTCSM